MRARCGFGVVAALIAVGACAGPGEETDVDEVEDVAGKADSVARPEGTYRRPTFGTGIVSLTLNADRTFVREEGVLCITAPCNPVVTSGSYRFTKSGTHRYIRFRDEGGDFLDRHEYTLADRRLALREDAQVEWTTLFLGAGADLRTGTASFIPSSDGMECSMPSVHCVTRDHSACPQLSPLPPTYCSDGEIRRGEPRFIDSADGYECSMPSVHCVTRDHFACPQLSPLPPDFCAGGEVVRGPDHFITSADGKECAMPSVHCVTRDHSACPQLSPIPPDYCG